MQNIPTIERDLYDKLMQSVTKEEVYEALCSMSPYKAPDPAGFQPVCFRTYWHIVEEDVWKLIANIFYSGNISGNLAETLIVPIPKVDAPAAFKDFRPISLCNVFFKLITKILVRRIRPHLDSFIGPLQGSFIPNRGTADNVIIAQEIVHNMHKKKGKTGYLMFQNRLRESL